MSHEPETRRRALSEETRTLLRIAAQRQGTARSNDVRERVHGAMTTIEQELKDNNGEYPHHNGELSQAEVARRAGIHPTTFFSPKQRKLGVEVRNWIKNLSKPSVSQPSVMPRSLAERVKAWKTMYDGLAQSHRDTELLLQQIQAELFETREELANLRKNYQSLLRLLNDIKAGKVVSLRNQDFENL